MEDIRQTDLPQDGEPKRDKKKRLWLIPALLAVLAALYCGICAYASSVQTIFPGVTVYGKAVGGLEVSQAEELLAQTPSLPDGTPITGLCLTDPADSQTLAPGVDSPISDLTFADLGGVEIDASASAQKAYEYCHGTNFFLSGWRLLSALAGRADSAPVLIAPRFAELAKDLAHSLSLEPVDAAYTLEEDSLVITVPRDGYRVDADDLLLAVEDALASYSYVSFDCPASPVPAKTLTAQEISDQVAGAAQDAAYDAETDSIVPDRAGASFDVAKAQAAMDAAAPGETVEVPAQVELPAVTAEELKELLFRDVLGQCTTHVSGTSARINNVKLAAQAFNGTILNAGETFSYNETVGQRTAEKGYKAAPAYINGLTVDEIGGGVCQPSSTLYLACLLGNLEITERYAHRYVPAYITKGMDATVSWGGPDFKFTNNTGYPLKIETSYENNYLTVTLLGTNVEGISVKMTYDTISTTPWKTVYEEDPSLAPGEERVKVTPYTGVKVKTYQTIYDADGNIIDSHYEATSDYKVRDKVVLRGPSVPAVSPEPLPEESGQTPEGSGGQGGSTESGSSGQVQEPEEPIDPQEPGVPASSVLPDIPAEPGEEALPE